MDTPLTFTLNPKLIKRVYNLGLKAVPNFLSLSEAQIEYYEKNLDQLPEAICRGFVLPKSSPEKASPKFELLADLGIITVPADYVHETQLASFRKKNQDKFYDYDDDSNDENFPNPTRILKPGDRLHVKVWKQIVSGNTTSEERMKFLSRQKSILTGAQGASLVFEQKRDRLPKGYWYSSFDNKSRLWKHPGGNHRVPGVRIYADGDYGVYIGSFERFWDDDHAFLSFSDVPLET